MWIVIVSLLVGCLLGASDRVPEKWANYSGRLLTCTLFVLLWALGAEIGGNEELIRSLPVIGWRAMAIAGASIAGSVLLLRLAAGRLRVLYREEGADQ